MKNTNLIVALWWSIYVKIYLVLKYLSNIDNHFKKKVWPSISTTADFIAFQSLAGKCGYFWRDFLSRQRSGLAPQEVHFWNPLTKPDKMRHPFYPNPIPHVYKSVNFLWHYLLKVHYQYIQYIKQFRYVMYNRQLNLRTDFEHRRSQIPGTLLITLQYKSFWYVSNMFRATQKCDWLFWLGFHDFWDQSQ